MKPGRDSPPRALSRSFWRHRPAVPVRRRPRSSIRSFPDQQAVSDPPYCACGKFDRRAQALEQLGVDRLDEGDSRDRRAPERRISASGPYPVNATTTILLALVASPESGKPTPGTVDPGQTDVKQDDVVFRRGGQFDRLGTLMGLIRTWWPQHSSRRARLIVESRWSSTTRHARPSTSSPSRGLASGRICAGRQLLARATGPSTRRHRPGPDSRT